MTGKLIKGSYDLRLELTEEERVALRYTISRALLSTNHIGDQDLQVTQMRKVALAFDTILRDVL